MLLRKKYYNQIEDMKGKVRVYCRARPLSKTEVGRGDQSTVESPGSSYFIVFNIMVHFRMGHFLMIVRLKYIFVASWSMENIGFYLNDHVFKNDRVFFKDLFEIFQKP